MSLLRVPAQEDHHGDEGEGEGGLPDLDLVGGVNNQDDQQPEVGEQGEDHGDTEHGVGLNLPRLPLRNDKYTENVKKSISIYHFCKMFTESWHTINIAL